LKFDLRVSPGLGKEPRTHEREVVERSTVRVAHIAEAAGAVKVDELASVGRGRPLAAAFTRLVAVAPLVVARRGDERVGERAPQRLDLRVVRLGAELLAGVDVADVRDEADVGITVIVLMKPGLASYSVVSGGEVWLLRYGASPYTAIVNRWSLCGVAPAAVAVPTAAKPSTMTPTKILRISRIPCCPAK
jgi:hypothetical protein